MVTPLLATGLAASLLSPVSGCVFIDMVSHDYSTTGSLWLRGQSPRLHTAP